MGPLKVLEILVVDDDPGCLGALEDFLGDEGHRIHTATRGLEAVEFVRQSRMEGREFHLSILDFDVPDLSGLETFERLTELVPAIGAIFISGAFNAGLESSLLMAGGFRVMAKPLDLVRMRRTIDEFCLRI